MLLIKDNIDLKELEKFEFKKNPTGKKYYYSCYKERIEIDIDERYIICESEFMWNVEEVLDKIFDLIQAGLIEKI